METKDKQLKDEYGTWEDFRYVGRTSAYYYGEDDDSVFAPDYWTYSSDIDDEEFAGEVYELEPDDAKNVGEYIRWWYGYNQWQRNNGWPPLLVDKNREEVFAYVEKHDKLVRE
jgi:hypothetical protein